MKSIVCQSCGGVLSSQPGKVIICEFCGRAYTKTAEEIRADELLLQQQARQRAEEEERALTPSQRLQRDTMQRQQEAQQRAREADEAAARMIGVPVKQAGRLGCLVPIVLALLAGLVLFLLT